jgi:hypothetical protein
MLQRRSELVQDRQGFYNELLGFTPLTENIGQLHRSRTFDMKGSRGYHKVNACMLLSLYILVQPEEDEHQVSASTANSSGHSNHPKFICKICPSSASAVVEFS